MNTVKSCCAYHFPNDPAGCSQGKHCPERPSLADCWKSEEAQGYEAALPIQMIDPEREPMDPQLKVLIAAVAIVFTAVLVLSVAPADFWARAVAAIAL